MKNLTAVSGAIVLLGVASGPFAYADTDMEGSGSPASQTIAGTLEQIDGDVYV
jgi:hypothetical protein